MISVGIIGAGNIGGVVAHRALENGWNVQLYDLYLGIAQGKAKDLQQAAVIGNFPSCSIQAVEHCGELTDNDFIVVTAGRARQPGMDRMDVLMMNKDVITSIAQQIQGTSATIIMVTNPVDTMSLLMKSILSAPRHQVIGMAGVLDTGRFKTLLIKALRVAPQTVQACVIGPHNDDMIPLRSSVRILGLPVSEDQLSSEVFQTIVQQTKHGGAEIVKLLEKGSAFHAPGEAVIRMIYAMAHDQQGVMPCSVWLEGEYGLKNLFCGVPAVLGSKGLVKVLELPLTLEEQESLTQNLKTLQEANKVCGL
jgi:malate dehydrogenase